jgi:two-component system chemotaxis family response regulator WspR
VRLGGDGPRRKGTRAAGIVTISVGAATGIPSASLTAEDLIARADTALYRSKEHGRNQVTMATRD